MPLKIAILEDNGERLEAMRECLADRFPMYDARFFDSAEAMVRFLEEHLDDTLVIALDHDLEPIPGPNGDGCDPGTGRDVADFLAARKPGCRVVIHTSNATAAIAMDSVLRGAGWKTKRVMPMDDLNWIRSEWFPAIRRAIVGPIRKSPRERRPVSITRP